MSWDVVVAAANEPPEPASEMGDEWDTDALGPCSEIRSKISACLPEVDWTDPKWGIYQGAGFSYEFNLGHDDPCESLMVHVRGGGDAVSPLLALASRSGWYLLDTAQGEWLHHCPDVNAGWQQFQEFRDRVIGDLQ